jgi:dGTPase
MEVVREPAPGQSIPSGARKNRNADQIDSSADNGLYCPSDLKRRLDVSGDYRSEFRRDFARLIHCPAFRRLQGKMQLFSGLESDFFRNRLTHSIEVAQVAKSLTLFLNDSPAICERKWAIDLDLVELAGMAHDIGHPPFGHTGERVLNRLMADFDGFEGNAQTLRVLSRLCKKLDNDELQIQKPGRLLLHQAEDEVAVGLNLCSRSLASILKYDRLLSPKASKPKGYYRSEAGLVRAIRQDVGARDDVPLKTVECQIMDIADDIAYSTYDLEDAFKVDLLTPMSLLYPPVEVKKTVCGKVGRDLGRDVGWDDALFPVLRRIFGSMFPSASSSPEVSSGFSHMVSRQWVEHGEYRTQLTSKLVETAIGAVTIQPDDEAPALSKVRMNDEAATRVSLLKNLTFELLVNTSRMRVVEHRGEQIVSTLFKVLKRGSNYRLMPHDYAFWYEQAPASAKPRVIADFIAGMTDRYAIEFYGRLTSKDFRSMFQPL